MPDMAVMWTLVFGFGSGATMILGLTFIGLRASSAHQAAALSGMAQSIGYLLAACGPPLMGKIHDTAGDWRIPLLACALAAVMMALRRACRARPGDRAPLNSGRPSGLPFYPRAARSIACTSTTGRPSSAARSCWNKVITKNGCVTSSAARISPARPSP
jgi:CP family cyanate transporter-like MFS transporter